MDPEPDVDVVGDGDDLQPSLPPSPFTTTSTKGSGSRVL